MIYLFSIILVWRTWFNTAIVIFGQKMEMPGLGVSGGGSGGGAAGALRPPQLPGWGGANISFCPRKIAIDIIPKD